MATDALAQGTAYNGLNLGLGNLSRLSKAKTRSISAENYTGEKGKAGISGRIEIHCFQYDEAFCSIFIFIFNYPV